MGLAYETALPLFPTAHKHATAPQPIDVHMCPIWLHLASGVPVAAARQMLPDASSLIGCTAADATAATAAAANGANFVILESSSPLPSTAFADMSAQQRSGLRIPFLVSASSIEAADTVGWLAAGPDGICGPVAALSTLASTAPSACAEATSLGIVVAAVAAGLKQRGWAAVEAEVVPSVHSGLLSGLLDGSQLGTLLGREKELMRGILDFLGEAVPEMEEAQLLKEALAGA
jgi:hypothetical protein